MSEGVKYDSGKPRWGLLPYEELEDVVKVLTFGSQKYADDNWKKVPDAQNRYFDAAMRHLIAWKKGEREDQETGISHLAHATCCLLFLQWFDKNDDYIAELIYDSIQKEANSATIKEMLDKQTEQVYSKSGYIR